MIPFIIASKIIKHLETELTKDMTGLYTENSLTLIKEIEDANTQKISYIHGLKQ